MVEKKEKINNTIIALNIRKLAGVSKPNISANFKGKAGNKENKSNIKEIIIQIAAFPNRKTFRFTNFITITKKRIATTNISIRNAILIRLAPPF